ncbi:asparagine synthetase B family protein [Sedimenticola selenatireducens]|uniref:asparagine synthetase B family protein n=1 Tax=Sedimenticola selenatireducens TaxID=191960 RepID=UPI0004B7DF96|nr:asparagine synthase-related protein [Sedimenticola selenatireducens]
MIKKVQGTGTLRAPVLAGIYSPSGSREIENALESFSKGLNSSLDLLTLNTGDCAALSSDSLSTLPGGGIIALTGHPRWKSAELQAISSRESHAGALSHAYLEHGMACLDYLEGPFSVLIMDKRSSRITAVTDRLGLHPIYYAQVGDGIVFGSSASGVLGHHEIEKELREDGIYDYVYFHMVPSPVSIYRNIKKIPAGHFVQLSNGALNETNYWLPRFSEQTGADIASLSVRLKNLLKSSVDNATDNFATTGSFLSGGLDSSTVTGFLSELHPDAKAFSIGFSAEGYDEMAFARITARHFGVDLNEYYVTPDDVVQALPVIATSYDEPFGNSSALPAYFCAKLARENGISRLLAGDGGDELFAGNERYAKQGVFEAYQKVPLFLRKDLLQPIVENFPGNFGVLNKARSYISQANTPLPDRLQTYNFLHQHSPAEIFSADFLSAVDVNAPLQLQRETYDRPADASTLNRMLYFDWQYTLADNDIRKVSHMCAVAGVEVTYPMLDESLLRFSLEIPSNLKLKGGNLRHFYKAALTNWLPQETIDKKKQGFGLPFGVWMQTHKPLQELAYESLLELKKTRYFNNGFLDHAIELHRKGHAAYYGELIWILMVLQLWMAKHAN